MILGLAAFLRCYQITSIPPGLYHDEAANGNDALENLETGHLKVFYPANNGREGLYINFATLSVHLFGNTAWALRLPAVVFGILTVLGIYLLATELFSTAIGLLAALFLATSFWHINFSRIGLRAIASPLFLAWGLYLLLRAMHRIREGRSFVGVMGLAGIVYGLGFHTYLAYRATPALLGLILLCYYFKARQEGWTQSFYRSATVFSLAVGLAVAPLVVYFWQHPGSFTGRAAEVSILRQAAPVREFLINIWKLIRMIFTNGDLNWRHNISGRPVVFWPVAIFFAIGAWIAVVAAVRRRDRWFPYAVALGWLAIGALPAALSSEEMPHALRSLLMAPAIVILAAVGAHRIYAILSQRLPLRWVQAGAGVLLLALSVEPYRSYFDVWARHPNVGIAFLTGAVEIADRVNAVPQSTSKIVVVAAPGNDIGMPAVGQTIMFLTETYTAAEQERRGVHYVTRSAADQPTGVAFCKYAARSLKPGQVLICAQVD